MRCTCDSALGPPLLLRPCECVVQIPVQSGLDSSFDAIVLGAQESCPGTAEGSCTVVSVILLLSLRIRHCCDDGISGCGGWWLCDDCKRLWPLICESKTVNQDFCACKFWHCSRLSGLLHVMVIIFIAAAIQSPHDHTTKTTSQNRKSRIL